MERQGQERRGIAAALLPRSHAADLGWGFVVAWGISAIFTGTFTSNDASNLGMFWLASMIGTPVGLIAFFLAKDPLKDTRRIDVLQVLALAGMVLGTAMLALSLWSSPGLSDGMQIGAGIISSLGVAVFTVLWGCRYTALDMQRIERSAAYSLIVAFACYACVLAVPAPIGMILIASFPFLSLLCLKSSQGDQTTVADTGKSGQALEFNVRGFVRLGLGIVGATTVVSLFWSMVNNGTLQLPHQLFEASVLSGTAVAVLLMVYMTNYSRSLNLGTLYRWVLPLIAIALAVLFVEGSGAVLLACLLAFAAQALLNLLTFVYFAELSKRTGVPPYKVFGLGRFFLEVGFLAGTLLVPLAMGFIENGGTYHGVFTFALAGLIVLVMSSISIQDRLAFTLEDRVLGASAPQESKAEPLMALEQSCDRVAEAYGLTNREREVLFYLAQGYSLPYIRNELYIAQSTIDTHVRHIYKKMDIHSKEELITEVRRGEKAAG